jgi:hypothetical protein
MVPSGHEQPIPVFQQLVRSDPTGRHDVREVPASLRFGPMFAAEIKKKRLAHMRGITQWRWHLDEVFVKI